jgi:adenylate kinase
MRIVLIGVQGAGKSTQGKLLAEKLDLPYLSSGHIFRQMATRKTVLGRWLKETLNAGVLVPDDKTIEIVSEYLGKPEYSKGYIIDGYPRTTAQAEAFSDGKEKVLLINVSDKEALWRIAGRIDDREDETLQAIRSRIEQFHRVTSEVIDYYDKKGQLVVVDGERDVDSVFKEAVEKLGIE